MKQIINLNAEDSTLNGRIIPGRDVVVFIDASDGSLTINLPSCALFEDNSLCLMRTDEISGNTVTYQGIDNQEISNAATQTLVVGEAIWLETNKSNWWKV